MKKSREIGGLILLLILGLAPRIAFITRFPTIPYSDFSEMVHFGEHFRAHGMFVNSWYWEYFNPGLPLVLSVLFRIFRGDPGSVARWATAVLCGLVPAIPYLGWRRVYPLWVRMLAGGALALWPGQVVFSGVVAQDNWVLVPTVGLTALAVRILVSKEAGRPLLAGLLLGAGAMLRQEMVVVLFPLFLAAAGVNFRAGRRRWAVAALAAGLPLVAAAAYRGAVTGRFSLNTEHGGISILGAYIPGATENGWVDPYPFIASVRPDLLRDRHALLAETPKLAFQEALRRPKFQAVRILTMLCSFSVAGEATSDYWSIGATYVLPVPLRARGAELEEELAKPLRYEMAGLQGLFLAALLIGIWRPNRAILAIAAAVLLKFAIHGLVAAQGRYFFPPTAMEILAIAVAAYEVGQAARIGLLVGALAIAVGMAFSAGLLVARFRLTNYIRTQDVDQPRTYHFPLLVRDRAAMLDCSVDHGLLVALNLTRESTQTAALRTLEPDPPSGDAATAVCRLTGTGAPRPLTLEVLDAYAPGGYPDKLVQRVEVDGVEVFSHDIARDPGAGWAKIPLGNVGAGTERKVVVEVKAIHPDPGPAWGNAAITTFQLSRD